MINESVPFRRQQTPNPCAIRFPACLGRVTDRLIATVIVMAGEHRGGRPHKGPRKQTTIRPYIELLEEVRARYKELGYEGYSDYVCALMAHDVGRPDLAPPLKRATADTQPALVDQREEDLSMAS